MGQIKNTALLKKIALLLKQLREENNLTQEDVYYDTSIHIGRIESFKINITVSTLSALCDYYDVSLHEFFKKMDNS
ncbi:MAG: helix-turn-helix transcriptional regulator [Chitinophagaceae bacterium]